MILRNIIFAGLVLSLAFSACKDPVANLTDPTVNVKVEITNVQKTTSAIGGKPQLIITLKNTGNERVHGVAVDVKALKNNAVVATTICFISNSPSSSNQVINPGESGSNDKSVGTLVLFAGGKFDNLSSHNEYDELRYEITYHWDKYPYSNTVSSLY